MQQKIKDKIKNNLNKALIFISGVIGTLIITKIWNTALPEKPILIKEVADSIKIVHEYTIPIVDDSLEFILEKKLNNIKLLNSYEQEIDERVKRIEDKATNILIPNLISLDISKQYKFRGYTQGNSNTYFTLNCPEINNTKYIDFRLDFFNPVILNEIAFIRLNIYKLQKNENKEIRTYILNEFYVPRIDNTNFIRIENTLDKGKYEFLIGFSFKSDLDSEYPTFYIKRCILIKN